MYTKKCTHPFNGHFPGTTQVSQYQNGKTNRDVTRSRQTTMPSPQHRVFTGRMPFVLRNEQHQSTNTHTHIYTYTEAVSIRRLKNHEVAVWATV